MRGQEEGWRDQQGRRDRGIAHPHPRSDAGRRFYPGGRLFPSRYLGPEWSAAADLAFRDSGRTPVQCAQICADGRFDLDAAAWVWRPFSVDPCGCALAVGGQYRLRSVPGKVAEGVCGGECPAWRDWREKCLEPGGLIAESVRQGLSPGR